MTDNFGTLESRVRRGLRVCGAIGLGLALLWGGAFVAYRVWLASGERGALALQLGRGLSYRRVALSVPRPAVAHVLRVDLRTAGLRMHITPPVSGSGCMPARTTSAFLKDSGVTVAINGSFFFPFRSDAPWDYYPKAGQCAHPLGVWRAQGQRYGEPWHGNSISFDRALRPQLGAGSDATPWTVTGAAVLVAEGRVQRYPRDGLDVNPYPRNALCLDRDRQVLSAILIDGRQPGYSEGLTLDELAAFVQQQGCEHAIELDGGGSVTLVARGADGEPRVLNRPIHTRIPGRERPIANHIGFAVAAVPGG